MGRTNTLCVCSTGLAALLLIWATALAPHSAAAPQAVAPGRIATTSPPTHQPLPPPEPSPPHASAQPSAQPSPLQPPQSPPPTIAPLPAYFREELPLPDTLGVARVAHDVSEHLPGLQAMSDYLGAGLVHERARRVRPLIARSHAEMIDFLQRGVADVVSDTPFAAIRFVEEAGARILLLERRDGVTQYHSMIFVRKDSGIATLADLRGKRVVFEHRVATSAFLLPLAAIKAAGLRTVELHDGRAAVPPDVVGYFFATAERPLVTTVRTGTADAGAISNLDWVRLERRNPTAASALRVIAETEPVPRSLLLLGPSVTPDLAQLLKATLLAMHEQDSGRRVLSQYNQVERYDDVDAALERSLERIRELSRLVREQDGNGGFARQGAE